MWPERLKAEMHAPDTVFRDRGDRFLALLNATDSRMAEAIGQRIVANLSSHRSNSGSGASILIDLSISSSAG
jgi:GGDEF domain-containing protein